MTFVLKLNLDIVKMYVYIENEALSFTGTRDTAWTVTQVHRYTVAHTHTETGRHTDMTEIITHPHV